jgi:hypothetical protein
MYHVAFASVLPQMIEATCYIMLSLHVLEARQRPACPRCHFSREASYLKQMIEVVDFLKILLNPQVIAYASLQNDQSEFDGWHKSEFSVWLKS